jgi:LruC domain-containing protein
VADSRALFGGGNAFINTDPRLPSLGGHALQLQISFGAAQPLDTGAAPFDVFIARSNDFGHQVHQPIYPGTDRMNTSLFGAGIDGSNASVHFVDHNGLPFALHVPTQIRWPVERTSIDRLYPDVVTFAQGEGAEGWYTTDVQTSNAYTQGANSSLAPLPVLLGPGLPDACP